MLTNVILQSNVIIQYIMYLGSYIHPYLIGNFIILIGEFYCFYQYHISLPTVAEAETCPNDPCAGKVCPERTSPASSSPPRGIRGCPFCVCSEYKSAKTRLILFLTNFNSTTLPHSFVTLSYPKNYHWKDLPVSLPRIRRAERSDARRASDLIQIECSLAGQANHW